MASSSSPTTPYLKHDVFLSFRGADTRKGFTSHLYHALQRNQINAYIDNKLDGGEKIEPALLERIEESFISLVIFSENYADSTFCLRELSKILECMETKQQMVLPVFYLLDPSHVQNLTGSYGDALCKHERDCSSEEVQSWRRALKEIANLKGWDSNNIKDETELIQKIVTDIQKKMSHAPSPSIDAERLVGMESRVEDIESLLSFGSTGVLIVGIWGMGGIGKSTTADVVYHRNRSKFEGHCFFQNVREKSKKHGVNHVRQAILGEVLEKKDMTIGPIGLVPDIKRVLQRKKVLIVLDDVNDPQDLKYLVGEDGLFGQGSRIIVTSRDRQVLINACDEDKIYEVKILDKDDALRLFSLHAFKQHNPIEGYIGLSKTVVSCVKGIPLVLEVLGASLYRKTSVEYWESKVAQLRTNGGEDIKKCLEMCYLELDQTEKKIFLDIACFFGRCKRDLLQQTLDLEERSGIDRLADMCLIKIVQDKIKMHDVLLKLGKKIVLQENVDPRERSRLWQADDIYRVLTTQRTGSKVESISLNLLATKELSPTAFEGMYNLRLLKIDNLPFLKNPSKEKIMNGKRVGIHLPGGLHFLSSELRFLYWYNYPLKSMPSNFFPEKLVQLEMPCSQLEQLWNEYQEFNFSNCLQLDQNSRTRIMGAAHLQLMPTFYQEYLANPFKEVRLCIPGSEVPEWFSYKNREGSSVKIQHPAHWHPRLTLCAVVSFGQSGERRPVNIKCECHLITKDGTQIDLSFYYYEISGKKVSLWEREHVFIWSVDCMCFFKEASFHFKPLWGATDVVKCGVHPLLKEEQPYAKMDKLVTLVGDKTNS